MSKTQFVSLLSRNVLFLVSMVLLVGCGGSLQEAPEKAWRYDGSTGPKNWGRLHPSFRTCARGKTQSPINLERALPQMLPRVRVTYKPTNAVYRYDGRLLRIDVEDGGEIQVARRRFKLEQVFFHAPSEHQIRGQEFPLEIQLVHVGHERTRFVISVFADHGPNRPELDWFWSALPKEGIGTQKTFKKVDFTAFLPTEYEGFRYSGSLTTPPCNEPVSWLVLESPIFVSPDRINTFKNRFPASQRPLQPTGNRPILTDSNPQAMTIPGPPRGRAL